MAARTASSKPSCVKPRNASRLLRQSKSARCAGSCAGIHPRHLADVGRQINRIERARRKTGATLAQRSQRLIRPRPILLSQ